MERLYRIAGAMVLCVTLVACGSKVNQSNFDRVQVGMTQAQVEQILGPPTETSTMGLGTVSGAASKWADKNSVITVQFLNDKVQAKQFSQTKND